MRKSANSSYCGLYCGACDIRITAQTGEKSGFAAFWTENNIKLLQNSQGYSYESYEKFKLKCSGCKSDEVFINCSICKIRNCAISKKMEDCSACGQYKCDLILDFEKGSSLLPHLTQAEENLSTINQIGMEIWEKDQELKWSCPVCTSNFSWYQTLCSHCGADLRHHSYGKFSRIRSLFFKLAIRSSSHQAES